MTIRFNLEGNSRSYWSIFSLVSSTEVVDEFRCFILCRSPERNQNRGSGFSFVGSLEFHKECLNFTVASTRSSTDVLTTPVSLPVGNIMSSFSVP
jgi:hypothetical protein